MADDDCRERNRQYQADWYQRNKEKKAVQTKAWRDAHPERVREITRESERRRSARKAIEEGREPGRRGRPPIFTADEKRAKRKARTEAYNAANINEVREAARIREAAKRAGTFVSKALPRLTEEERKLVQVTMSANRRARIRENGGVFTREDVLELRALQHGLCLFCGDPLGDELPHVDHWIPIVRGGPNSPENLALLHEFCNLRKGAKLPSEFGLPDDPATVRAALDPPLVRD